MRAGVCVDVGMLHCIKQEMVGLCCSSMLTALCENIVLLSFDKSGI